MFWGPPYIPLYSPQYFNRSYSYLAQPLSLVEPWTFLTMESLCSFSMMLWHFEVLWMHNNWCLSPESLPLYNPPYFIDPVHISTATGITGNYFDYGISKFNWEVSNLLFDRGGPRVPVLWTPFCIIITRVSEVIMFSPGVFVCLCVCVSMFVTMFVRTI